MTNPMCRIGRALAGGMASLVLLGSQTALADEIKLKDGTTVSATVLQRDGEQVILQVPRAAIETVNGAPLPPPVVAGAPAPLFTAVDVAGVTHALAENGGRPTLLQFWASWCPHCRSDVPLVKRLFAQHQERLRLLTVSVDQDVDALRTFIQQEQLTYPIISTSSHPALPDLYEMQGIPTYYLIGADGAIVQTWSGSVTERPSDFEDAVTRLISGPGPQAAAGDSAN